MATSDAADLRRRTQENLVTFLRQEVKLGNTFCKIAETTKEPAHRSKLLHDIETAVKAIRHFDEQIGDQSIRAELNGEAAKLEKFLSRAESFDQV